MSNHFFCATLLLATAFETVLSSIEHQHSKFLAQEVPPAPPTVPKKEKSEETTESSIGGWGIFFAIVIVILIIIGVLYFYNMYKEHIINTEGAMKTELGIRKQELSQKQIMLLNVLTFNSKNEEFTKRLHCSDVIVKQTTETVNKVTLGEYMKIEFKGGSDKMIVCNYPLSEKKENSYFEIEIESIRTTQTEENEGAFVGIGFIAANKIAQFTSKPYQFMFREPDSVIFTTEGKVQLGSQIITLGINSFAYGETIGIGFSRSSQRVWLTADGEFLNPPPLSELQKQDMKDEKTKAALQLVEENAKSKEELKIQKQQEEERVGRVIKMQVQKNKELETIYPFIMSNCECVIDVNVGGYPFRFNQKEIAAGLLE